MRWLRVPRDRGWPLDHDLLDVDPPGDHIAEALEERAWTKEHLARELGLGMDDTEALLAGRLPIERPLAERLAAVVGGTADYWQRLQERWDLAETR